jgi:hypothetical protein
MICCRLLPLLLLATPARADQVALTPATSDIRIRIYSLGWLPIDGNYTRFEGRLTYDPTDRARCRVDLTADAAGLTMADAAICDDVVGPEFMDTARFPTLESSGACQGLSLQHAPPLHGVTRGFVLGLERIRDQVIATGRLRRAGWGITARLFPRGATVRIQVSTIPPTATAQGAPGR